MTSSSNEGNHNIADVLLYAESKLTRKQAIREIADVVLKANMKPKTVKYALDLLKILLPTENTLPSTVDELFGAMLSSENDWRLAQYLIKHKQRPSFSSTSSSSSPNTWNENSSSINSLVAAASSSSMPTNQEFNSIVQSPSLFLPISASSSSGSGSGSDSSSNSESESESESESGSGSRSESNSSESDSSEDDDDDDERNILLALQEAQQQRANNSPPIVLPTESSIVETNANRMTNINDTSDQRSQIVSSSLNRFPFLGSFKRERSETSSDDSSSEPDLFFPTRLPNNDDDDSDDDDDETPFYPISNNNNNNKSCCFEMNGCDLLDGGKRRRH